MLSKPVRLLAVLSILAVPLLESAAQDRYAEIAARHGRVSGYHEAIVLPGDASAQAIVAFRIPSSLLVFVQDGNGFLAEAEVTVELLQQGKKVDEAIWRGEKRASSFAETRSDGDDVAGHVRFELDPGTYAYRVDLTDARSSPSGPSHPFEVPAFSTGGIGTPVFAAEASNDGSSFTLEPVNLGGDAPYGGEAAVAVPVSFSGSDAMLEYRLYQIKDLRAFEERRARERRGASVEEFELSADDQRIQEGSMDLESTVAIADLESGCLCWSVVGAGAGRLALIDLQTESLQSGAYVLDLMLRSDEVTLQRRAFFETHWRDMPLSLYDVEVAIRNLSFIESRDQIRAMLKGSRVEQVAAFRAYWEQRDPSPGTIKNELMEEYYQRVDHAASEFRTGKTPFADGLRTDAAGVYVVHGPPDDVSSTFPSTGGVQQVWTYPDGRRFVFWASSSLDPLVLEETETSAGRSENGS